MKYSLFRRIDVLEIAIMYFICFSVNLILIYVSHLALKDSFMLASFIASLLDFQLFINIGLTFMIILFHYQFLVRKKTEVSCRFLVGDSMFRIKVRYVLHHLTILICSFLLSLLLSSYLELQVTSNLYLFGIFIIYIICSVGQVKEE